MVGYVSFLEGMWSSFFAYLRWISDHRLFTKKTSRGYNSKMIWPRKDTPNWVNLSGRKIPLGKGTSSSNMPFLEGYVSSQERIWIQIPNKKNKLFGFYKTWLLCVSYTRKPLMISFQEIQCHQHHRDSSKKKSHNPISLMLRISKKRHFFARLKLFKKLS